MSIILVLDKGEAHDPDPGHLHVLFYDLTKDDFECKSADFYDCCGENKTLRIADLLLDVSDKGEIKVNYLRQHCKRFFTHCWDCPHSDENNIENMWTIHIKWHS